MDFLRRHRGLDLGRQRISFRVTGRPKNPTHGLDPLATTRRRGYRQANVGIGNIKPLNQCFHGHEKGGDALPEVLQGFLTFSRTKPGMIDRYTVLPGR